jgi:four helix bundle protein
VLSIKCHNRTIWPTLSSLTPTRRSGEYPIYHHACQFELARIILKSETITDKVYDLEERTKIFAKRIRAFTKKIPYSYLIIDDLRQLIRSSGSIGANYLEANEALSRKDFVMRIKIARKESREAIYWLELLELNDETLRKECEFLIQEATELMNILSAIMRKSV